MLHNISIKKLFGLYNHNIELFTENNVTIIHGPNGTGKTTMLKFIEALSNLDFEIFFEIPYNEIRFGIKKSVLIITRDEDKKSEKPSLIFTFNKKSFTLTYKNFLHPRDSPMAYGGGIVRPGFYSNPQASFVEWESVDISKITSLQLYRESLRSKHNLLQLLKIPKWLITISEELNTRFISAQRLERNQDEEGKSKVEIYRLELIKYIQSYEKEYAIKAKDMDASFPKRIIEIASIHNSKNQIEALGLILRIQNLSTIRKSLSKRGILTGETPAPYLDDNIKPDDINDNNTLKQFLELYSEDSASKFSVFNDFFDKIKPFENIFNNLFYNKKFIVHRDKGVQITMRNELGKEMNVPLDKLSSGEKQYFILFYELMFKTKEKQLILIDEPELSLHVAWQVNMVDQFLDVSKSQKLNVILATHSSAIMRNHKNIVIGVGYPNDKTD